MREILPNQLWIGNAGDGRDPERLLRAGVAAVINLAAEEPSPDLPRSMIYCHFPLVDGPQDDEAVLDMAIQTVVSLLKKQIPTLVYCGAGMSRSPAVVAAALSIVQGGSPDEKLKEIVAGHPHDVSPHLWEAVCRACRALHERVNAMSDETTNPEQSPVPSIPRRPSNRIVLLALTISFGINVAFWGLSNYWFWKHLTVRMQIGDVRWSSFSWRRCIGLDYAYGNGNSSQVA